MFTVCPKCSLKLVVTAADLRVAQGYVRCGRCSNIFNALVGLSDEQQAVLAREQRKDAASLASVGPSAAPPESLESPDWPPSSDAAEAPAPPESHSPPESLSTPEARVRAQSPPSTESVSLPESPAPFESFSLSESPAQSESPPPSEALSPPREIARQSSADELLSDAALEFDAGTTDVSAVFVQPALDDTGSTGQSETIILRSEDEQPEEPAEEPESPEESADSEEARPDDRDGVSLAVQFEPGAKSLEETDEFELADLEPLLKASTARDAITGRNGSADLDAARALEASEEPEASEARDAPRVSEGSGVAHGASDSRSVSPSSMRDVLEGIAPAPAPARGRGRIFVVGSAALVLLLAAQIVHHYRTKLAEIAWLRPALTATYAALGMPLAPHWNVRAYEVRQLGAVVGPGNPGTLTVRASIENTAPREQPLPLLRVTVQDRFGNRVAARDVPPAAYLPKTSAAHKYLGAGERVDAEIALVDPGPRVVGFEIDACLEDASERVSCAHQPSSLR